jgi:hypothetical protein
MFFGMFGLYRMEKKEKNDLKFDNYTIVLYQRSWIKEQLF